MLIFLDTVCLFSFIIWQEDLGSYKDFIDGLDTQGRKELLRKIHKSQFI